MSEQGRTNRSKKVRETAALGMLFALAMVLGFVENMLPVTPGLPPGVKLGLSNIVTMYCVFFLGYRQAYTLAVLKGTFALLTRGVMAGAMSTVGGFFSVTVMLVLIGFKRANFSYIVISVFGSLGHNIGQLVMASIIMQSSFTIYYLPIMAVSGVGMGVLTGVILRVLLPYMNKFNLSSR